MKKLLLLLTLFGTQFTVLQISQITAQNEDELSNMADIDARIRSNITNAITGIDLEKAIQSNNLELFKRLLPTFIIKRPETFKYLLKDAITYNRAQMLQVLLDNPGPFSLNQKDKDELLTFISKKAQDEETKKLLSQIIIQADQQEEIEMKTEEDSDDDNMEIEEPKEEKKGIINYLPQEIKQEIANQLKGKSLEESIQNIMNLAQTDKSFQFIINNKKVIKQLLSQHDAKDVANLLNKALQQNNFKLIDFLLNNELISSDSLKGLEDDLHKKLLDYAIKNNLPQLFHDLILTNMFGVGLNGFQLLNLFYKLIDRGNPQMVRSLMKVGNYGMILPGPRNNLYEYSRDEGKQEIADIFKEANKRF